MPAPPSYQKVNPGDDAVMQLVLYSSTLPASQVDEYAESTIAQRISTVPGVAQVQVGGAAKLRRARRSRSAQPVGTRHRHRRSRVRDSDRRTSTCRPAPIYGADHTYTILANGQMLRARSIRVDDRRLPQRQTRCVSTPSRTSTTASRTTSRRSGSTVSAPSRCRCRSSRAPTSSRSSTR